jgi:hypothetical protein
MDYRIFKNKEYESTVADTITFILEHGAKLVKYFLLINIFIIVLQSYISYTFPFNFEEIYNKPENYLTYILVLIPIFLLLILFINTFFQFALHNQLQNLNVKNILLAYKGIGTKFIYIIPMILVWTVVYFIICSLLAITIIGIPVIFIILPSFFIWMEFSINDYFFHGATLKTTFGKNFKRVRKDFWHNTGTTIVIFIVTTILGTVFSFIPMIFSLLSEITSQSSIEYMSFFKDYQQSFLGNLSSTFRIDFILSVQFLAFGMMYFKIRNEEVEIDLAIEQLGKQ